MIVTLDPTLDPTGGSTKNTTLASLSYSFLLFSFFLYLLIGRGDFDFFFGLKSPPLHRFLSLFHLYKWLPHKYSFCFMFFLYFLSECGVILFVILV